jgi:SPP1 family predicted phage head-tail adaptor
MQAGQLRHPVTIQELTTSLNDYGETVEAWSDWENVFAEIKPQSSREFQRAKQLQADATHVLKIRYLPGVTSGMRVKFGDRILNLMQPPLDEAERNRELLLICREIHSA